MFSRELGIIKKEYARKEDGKMPSPDLRHIVMNSLSASSSDEIKEYIQDAINTHEDAALPGMGILFEVVWGASSEEDKNKMMEKIMQEVQKVSVS